MHIALDCNLHVVHSDSIHTFYIMSYKITSVRASVMIVGPYRVGRWFRLVIVSYQHVDTAGVHNVALLVHRHCVHKLGVQDMSVECSISLNSLHSAWKMSQ